MVSSSVIVSYKVNLKLCTILEGPLFPSASILGMGNLLLKILEDCQINVIYKQGLV